MYAKAVKAIDAAGILLVYPIKNADDPPSIWSKLYPKSKMSWDWSDDADDRVVDLWHLRTELSEGRDVVYAKWFRGRATFFSRPICAAMLRLLGHDAALKALDREGRAIYQELLEDSTQTPKMLRAALDMQGPLYESAFNRGLKQLWERLVVVGFGEIDEGNFPALAIGATKSMFEELWDEARAMSEEAALARVEDVVAPGTTFHKQLTSLRRRVVSPLPVRSRKPSHAPLPKEEF